MDIAQVMQAAATIVAAKISAREARSGAPMSQADLIKELALARDAVWASLKLPQQT